ncbi:ribonuclease Z [Candidatus Woesearchaeota archaeon]|nr:ribonuclease Z [Candidatus Woesearchaeota archaeon]
MIEITFLGTSAMVPTKERNVTGIFLRFKNEGILMDCGEGTQRQMNIASINRNSVTKILVSHWHGDHVSGIVGLLQTMAKKEDNPRVDIYGPKGTDEHVKNMIKMVIFDIQVDLKVHELLPKKNEVLTALETEDYIIQCAQLDHKIPCIGYSFIEKDRLNIDPPKMRKLGMKEGPHLRKLKLGQTITYKDNEIKPEDVTYEVKGKKITYIADTQVCENAIKLAQGSDLLISESVYAAKLKEKAREYKHLTSEDAATIASQAEVLKLVLTHFSQRYKTVEEIEEDAKLIFPETVCAYDFMKIKV